MEIIATIAVATIVVGFMFWRYHVLAKSYDALHVYYDILDENLASELQLNQVLLDRAEKAEAGLRFTNKQLDALLVIPQPPHGDGATVIPKMIVIVDGKEA